VHEIAHAHGLGYPDYGHERCEVLVDCVTNCVLGSIGLDAIRDLRQPIDTIARQIDDAFDPEPEIARASAAIAVPRLAA
jgi:hypothetical protein